MGTSGFDFRTPANELRPVQGWEHEVDDEQVVGIVRGEIEARLPIRRTVHGKAFRLEAERNETRDFFFIFDKEDSHGRAACLHDSD